MLMERQFQAIEAVAREACCIDEQRWADWLDLYTEDAVFWLPMWKSATALTSDPDRELSHIYLQGRSLLEERVARLASGRSVASVPLPRTAHLVGGHLVHSHDGGATVELKSAWRSQVYMHKDHECVEYAGRYVHQLVLTDAGYRIREKKIILNTPRLISKLDFFYV